MAGAWLKRTIGLELVPDAGDLRRDGRTVADLPPAVAANEQIEQAENALRANTIFAIQKDGRELIQSISSDPKVYRFIFEFDKNFTADAETQLKARIRIGQLINFYASMWNQYQAGAVDARFWKTGLSELCFVWVRQSVVPHGARLRRRGRKATSLDF